MKPFLVAKEIPTKPEGFLSELGTAAPPAEAIRRIQVAKSTACTFHLPASEHGWISQLSDPAGPGVQTRCSPQNFKLKKAPRQAGRQILETEILFILSC